VNTRLAWALAAFVLQACTSPGASDRHALPSATLGLPEAWQSQSGTLSVESAWWRGFNDSVLNALVAEALQRNLDLRQATARLEEAHFLSAAQRAEELPSLRAGVDGNRSRSISAVALKPYQSGNQRLDVQASYEVDLWGRVRALTAAAQSNEGAVRENRDAVALSVAASVATAYVALRAFDAQVDLARQVAHSREQSVEIARRRQREGQGAALDRAQAEAELRATTQAIPRLELARQRQEQSLTILLGRSQGPVERGLPVMEIHPQPLPSAGLPSELLRRRPDIASAESRVAAADSQLAAARARLLPSLNLAASIGGVSSTIFHGDPFSVWTIGGSVLAPIFNGGELRSLAAASSARLSDALIGYQKIVLVSLAEVETQLTAVSSVAAQLSEAERQSTALEEAFRIAGRRYAEGYSSYLDQLLAERGLYTAQETILQLRADALVAEISLYRALGGGWQAGA